MGRAFKKIFNGVGIAWNSYKSITGIADYYKEAQFSFETTKLQKQNQLRDIMYGI